MSKQISIHFKENNIIIKRLKFFLYQPGLALSILIILLALAFIIFPSLFTNYNPIDEVGAKMNAPSLTHWLGTDELGRDLYSRLVYGAINTLSGALTAVVLGFVVGGLLGLFAGSLGGFIDAIIMRFVDVLLAIPSLLLSLSIITLLGFGTFQVAIAVGVTSIAGFARLTRAEVARIRHAEFIEAAFGSGASFIQVLYRHILPNAIFMIVGYAALQFGHALLQIATLGFLGYGVQPPTPEWGLMIAEGRNYIATSWWLTIMPGLFVIGLVVAANRIGRAITGKASS